MNSRQTNVRQRVVAAAAEMLARHGLNATSIREMIKRAKAPLGSAYHHFPRGKEQMVVEAVAFAGAQVSRSLERHLQAGPVAGLRSFLSVWREVLIRSDFRMGCPVMAVAVEEPVGEAAEKPLDAAATVFADWEGKLAATLQVHGRDARSATELATLIVASVEGAIVLCRARRSISSFDRVARELERLVHTQVSH
jgi:AcrR family transcriptional regulator